MLLDGRLTSVGYESAFSFPFSINRVVVFKDKNRHSGCKVARGVMGSLCLSFRGCFRAPAFGFVFLGRFGA